MSKIHYLNTSKAPLNTNEITNELIEILCATTKQIQPLITKTCPVQVQS